MTYIPGILCFAAVMLSAIMLIFSVNARKINTRFWCIFLCVSLVCSVIFYGVHNSVLSKKTAPTIDFSGFVPQIDEYTSEEKPLFEEPQKEPENPQNSETPEENSEDTSSQPDAESGDGSDYGTNEHDNAGTTPSEDTYPETPSGDSHIPEDINPDEDAPTPPEEELPPSPPEIEIEYEGPFRT